MRVESVFDGSLNVTSIASPLFPQLLMKGAAMTIFRTTVVITEAAAQQRRAMRTIAITVCSLLCWVGFAQNEALATNQFIPAENSYLSKDWYVECEGPRFCEIWPVITEKGRSERFETSPYGPTVRLRTTKPGKRRLVVEPFWLAGTHDNLTLTIGDQAFSVSHLSSRGGPTWHNADAVPIVRAFMKENYLEYSYISADGTPVSGRISLMGFTDAWNWAANDLGFNALDEVEFEPSKPEADVGGANTAIPELTVATILLLAVGRLGTAAVRRRPAVSE